jgi:hypothetical protein
MRQCEALCSFSRDGGGTPHVVSRAETSILGTCHVCACSPMT